MAGIPGLGFLGNLPGLGWTKKIPGNPLGVGASTPAPVTDAATIGSPTPPALPGIAGSAAITAADRHRKRTRAGMTLTNQPRVGPTAKIKPTTLVGGY